MKSIAIIYGFCLAQPLWQVRRLHKVAAGFKLGVGYWRAAGQDEKNGFPFSAAMEWRKAAELFDPVRRVSDWCWQEWERIMHLPRSAAGHIGSGESQPHYARTYVFDISATVGSPEHHTSSSGSYALHRPSIA
jgi:hypothetical protein